MESWEPMNRIRGVLLQIKAATFDMLLQRTMLPVTTLAQVLNRMEAEHIVTGHMQSGHAYWTLDR